MTLPEAEKQAETTKQYLLSLVVEKNRLQQQIIDAEEDNAFAARQATLLQQRERQLQIRQRRGTLPPVEVSDYEMEMCKQVLVDPSVREYPSCAS